MIDEKKLAEILAKYPTLSDHGMGRSLSYPDEPYRLPMELKGVEDAMRWIADRCEMTKTIRTRHSSYGLKHMIEDEGGPYTTNGQFILAALLLGYRVDSKTEVNPYFNLKVKKAALAKR